MARLVGRSKIRARLQTLGRKVDQIKDFAHSEFQKTTPIRTGNARKNTNRVNVGIEANYDYANKLNNGYSRQAPEGMTTPTVEAIQAYVRRM